MTILLPFVELVQQTDPRIILYTFIGITALAAIILATVITSIKFYTYLYQSFEKRIPSTDELAETVTLLSDRVSKLERKSIQEHKRTFWLENILYLAVETIDNLNGRIIFLGDIPPPVPKALEDWKITQNEWKKDTHNTPARLLLEMHRLINEHFNLSEIATLAMGLSVNPDELGDGRLSDRSRNLILAMDRENRLYQLADHCNTVRPTIDWPTFPERYSD